MTSPHVLMDKAEHMSTIVFNGVGMCNPEKNIPERKTRNTEWIILIQHAHTHQYFIFEESAKL